MKETEGLRKELEKMKPLLGPDALMHEAFKQMAEFVNLMTGRGSLGAYDNAITLFDARGRHSLGHGPKLEQARKLVAHVASMLPKKIR